MIDILAACSEVLSEAGFSTRKASIGDREMLAFEDATVLGFLFAYDDPNQLVKKWVSDADRAVASNQLGLRRAAEKAWNTYLVILTTGAADDAQSVALGAIEEDLTGTRKIVRAGIIDITDVRAALLPLLPVQSAPKLEAVDIVDEIRQRATELPARALEAFLSNADEAVVIQVLEETP
jgi:hypothetical protein